MAVLIWKIRVDYFVTNRTTLSLSGIKVHGEFKPKIIATITTDSLYPKQVRLQNIQVSAIQ